MVTSITTSADSLAVTREQEEIKQKERDEKRQAELESSIGYKLGNITGVDADNFGANASGASIFGGCLQVAASPVTTTFNILGGIMGADISETNSYDGQTSSGGFFGSIGTLFKGFGNVLGGIAGALGGNNSQTQNKTQQQQQSAGTTTSKADTTTDKTESSKTEKPSTPSASTPSASTASTSTPEKAGTTKTSNFTLGSLTHGSNGLSLTSSNVTTNLNTFGYEKYDSAVRAAVEEHTEACNDKKAANEEYAKAQAEYNKLEKEVTDKTQKAYADAKGAYDGAVLEVSNLEGKLSSISADIKGREEYLKQNNLPVENDTVLSNLTANKKTVEDQLTAAKTKRDDAEVKMAEAEKALGGAAPTDNANKLAGAKAKEEAAKAKLETATKLEKQTKTQAENAAKAAKEKDEDKNTKNDVATKANADALKKECEFLDENEKATYVAENPSSNDVFKGEIAKLAATNQNALTENDIKTLKEKYGVSDADATQALKVANARTGKTSAAVGGGKNPVATTQKAEAEAPKKEDKKAEKTIPQEQKTEAGEETESQVLARIPQETKKEPKFKLPYVGSEHLRDVIYEEEAKAEAKAKAEAEAKAKAEADAKAKAEADAKAKAEAVQKTQSEIIDKLHSGQGEYIWSDNKNDLEVSKQIANMSDDEFKAVFMNGNTDFRDKLAEQLYDGIDSKETIYTIISRMNKIKNPNVTLDKDYVRLMTEHEWSFKRHYSELAK